MVDAVLGGAEDDPRPLRNSEIQVIESAQEFHAAHHRHVPVEQDHVGPVGTAEGQCLLPIGGLLDRKGHALQYMARDLADDLAVIDDQTGFRHIVPPTTPGFASSSGKGVARKSTRLNSST